MLSRLRSAIALSFVLAGGIPPATASAALLLEATWSQAIDTVSTSVPMTRTRFQLGATGSSTATSISVSLSYPQTTPRFFLPKTQNGTLDLAVTISQGGAQAITATPSMATGSPGIAGTVILMTANHVPMNVNQSMFVIGANTLLQVPLSIGRDGQFVDTFIVLGVTHGITVDFYGWTPGTLLLSGLSSRYVPAATSTLTAMGSFLLTAGGAGPVTLVSASLVRIDCALAQQRTASFTTLTLFFPEPSTLWLLGVAALGLGLAALRRG